MIKYMYSFHELYGNSRHFTHLNAALFFIAIFQTSNLSCLKTRNRLDDLFSARVCRNVLFLVMKQFVTERMRATED
jgi:hypothetical protein